MVNPPPNPPPGKPAPWWVQFVGTTFVASVLTLSVNVWTTHLSERDKQIEGIRTSTQAFTKVLNDSILDKTVLTANSTVEDEQKAAAALMVLDALAETEAQHRTTLLIGGRLLNASSKREDTGHPAARFLDVAIGELDAGDHALPSDQQTDLLALVRSRGFVDLATSGYSTTYYNDADDPKSTIQPTLFGDQPITHEAKAELLVLIGPKQPIGWVHLASWRTERPFDAQSGRYAMWTSKTLEQYSSSAQTPMYNYAQPEKALSDWLRPQVGPVRLIRARLLRDERPLVYVSDDGRMRTGTLGRVVGAIPAGACVDVLATDPVVVFLSTSRLKPAGVEAQVEPVIHLWAQVRMSQAECTISNEKPAAESSAKTGG